MGVRATVPPCRGSEKFAGPGEWWRKEGDRRRERATFQKNASFQTYLAWRECRSMTDPTHAHTAILLRAAFVLLVSPPPLSRPPSLVRSNRFPPWCVPSPPANAALLLTQARVYTNTHTRAYFPSLFSVIVLSLSSSLALTRTTRPAELATPCLARPAGGQKRGRPGAALPRPRSSCCAYLRPQGQIRRAVPAVVLH